MALEQEQQAEAPGRSEELAEVRTLISAGKFADAETALSDLIARDDAPAMARVIFSQLLLRLNRGEEALAMAEDAYAIYPNSVRVKTLLATVLLRLDRAAEAEKGLLKARKKFPDDASVYALLAETYLAMGLAQKALGPINRAYKLEPDQPAHMLHKIVILAAVGKLDQAEKTLRRVREQKADLTAIYRRLITLHTKSGRNDEAMSLSENLSALLPDGGAQRIWLADRFLVAGQPQLALDAVEMLEKNLHAGDAGTMDVALSAMRIRARALQALGDTDGKIAALKNILTLVPDDQIALRDLYSTYQATGRMEDARPFGLRLISAGAKDLPSTLADGLDALRARTPPPGFWSEKAKWAWALADQSAWDREAWLAAAYWGQNADKLLRAWWLNAEERGNEIVALIDPPDLSALDSLPKGAGCLMAGTHLGPVVAGVHYLRSRNYPFRVFGVAGPDPIAGGGAPTRIAITDNAAASLRELVRELKSGAMIGFGADSPGADDSIRIPFLGRAAELSALVPRLVWTHRMASFWMQSLWRGGRIVVEIERLPDPGDGEPLEEWCVRWCSAYLQRIERVMRGAPENLNLGPGIWAHAQRTAPPGSSR